MSMRDSGRGTRKSGAAQRKKAELGPLLGTGQRGGVVTDETKYYASLDGIYTCERIPVDADAFRTALLFVDQIDYPVNSMIKPASADPMGLVSLGVLRRSRLLQSAPVEAEALRNLAFEIYCLLETREPGRWSIWHGAGEEPIPRSMLGQDLAFKLLLQASLLVPHRDVPFEDVLLFKDARRAELDALRHHMEELCIRVSQTGPDPRLMTLESEKFDRALSQYLKVARETNWKKGILNLEISMNWAEWVRASAAATLSSAGVVAIADLPLSAAVMQIGGSAIAAFSLVSAAGLRQTEARSPFAYLAQIEREWF